MDIAFSIDETIFNDEFKQRVAGSLGCDVDELPSKLEQYAHAAFFEYAYMSSGYQVFTRYTDLREYRLYLLIKFHFGGIVPSSRDVANVFHVERKAAQSILRSTLSKYRNELEEAISRTAIMIIKRADAGESGNTRGWILKNVCEGMVQELNLAIEIDDADGNATPLRKQPGSFENYFATETSYQLLRAHYLGNDEGGQL